jgi:hypothetical protein
VGLRRKGEGFLVIREETMLAERVLIRHAKNLKNKTSRVSTKNELLEMASNHDNF